MPAPEILQSKPLSVAHDYWCLGIMLYEMLVGSTPFECEDKELIKSYIENLETNYPINMDISKDTKELVCNHKSCSKTS